MKKITIYILFIMSLLIYGCAPSSSEVKPTHTSHILYKNYTCSELDIEYADLDSRISSLKVQQDEIAKKDRAAVGVSTFLFWPAMFAASGIKGGSKESELADLLGKRNAVEKAIKLNCNNNKNNYNNKRSNKRPSFRFGK